MITSTKKPPQFMRISLGHERAARKRNTQKSCQKLQNFLTNGNVVSNRTELYIETIHVRTLFHS